MTNEEIKNAVTSNGMREWTDTRVDQALAEARRDEAIAFAEYPRTVKLRYVGNSKWEAENLYAPTLTTEQVYEQFKEQNKKPE